MHRIVVTGSESTGKTTLARELAGALHAPWVPEYSRDYAEGQARQLTAHDVDPIARGQVAREDAVIAHGDADGLVILDTDLVSTTVYAEYYYGSCPPWIMEEARRRLGQLYLLCAPDIPWYADGIRDQPEARAELHARFEARLGALGALVLAVSGLGDRRLQHALAAVRGWRATL